MRMDPITLIVTALAFGAAFGLKATAPPAIKNAYAGLKQLIQDRYAAAYDSVEHLEKSPESKSRHDGVEEELEKTGAATDADLVKQARALVELVMEHDREAAYRSRIDLGDRDAALLLGNLLEEQGRLDEAEAAYRIRVDIGYLEAARLLGDLLKNQGRLDEAETLYRSRIDLGEGDAFYLGNLLAEQGRLDEAEPLYRTAIDLGFSEAAVNLGVLLKGQGRLDEAEAAFEAARSLGFEDPAGDAAAKRA